MSLPHFVKVELLKDGTALLIDDDGEEFHVEMRRDQAWPMMTRKTRRFEVREAIDKRIEAARKPPEPPQRFTLTTVKDK